MVRLRFALIFPLLIVCLDFPVALWQRHVDALQRPKHEAPVVSAVTLAYRGLNAPAVIFQGLCVATLPFYRADYASPALFGIGAGQLLFFTGVVLLWFAVGLFFDRRRSCRVHYRSSTTTWRMLGTLLLLTFTILLFGGGVFVMKHLPRTGAVGDVWQGALCFAWSVVFAFASVMRHVDASSSNAL